MSAADTATSHGIADAAQRGQALDPARSFIVQAPAGSGKTELLTRRLLVLLAGCDEPEEVVAMTFTRKAAAEMRHRVFGAIRAARDQRPVDDAYARETQSLACKVLERSRERGWRLDESPQRLRILTIDALCMQITQQSPLTAGFGGRVEITDLPEPLYLDAARAVIAGLEQDPGGPVRRVLRHFDNRVDRLETQLVQLLGKRDQWLRLVTVEQRDHHSRQVLEQTFEWVVRDALRGAAAALPDALRDAWIESAAYAARHLAPEDPDQPLQQVGSRGWPDCEPASLPRWLALVDLVLKADDEWRRTVNKNNGFPAGQGKAGKEEARAAKDRHLALIATLAEVPELRTKLAVLRHLPDPKFDDAQWDVLDALLDTLKLAAAHLRLSFAEHGRVDFAEVAGQAVAALGDSEGPSDLALRLDYRIRHLLVDEFQDTSALQWRLLERLTAGWSEADGHSLFVVGDPMQSIYRFREADVGLYLRAWRDGIGDLPLAPLRLTCNFRSDAGIVDWVNRAFAQVLPQQADLNRSAVPYSAAEATRAARSQPAVALHALVDADDDAEADCVVGQIRRAREDHPDGSIAVLVRSRGHLARIAPALRAAGIATRAVDIEALAERPVIEDLRALTRALLHPLDRIAWLAVLRAPWCGLRLADLQVLAETLPRHAAIVDALRDPLRWQALSPDGRARLEPVRVVLEAALSEQYRRSLRRWIETTWLALGGPACAGGEAALADAAVFFECLQKSATGATLDDLDRLDLALAQLRATPEADGSDAVSLMTIHKSKGLEFDTVILPGLARGTRSDDPAPVAWAHLPDVDGHARLLLAPVHATGAEREASYDYVRALDADKQRLEDARLLYVAATRARHRLHLIAGLRPDDEGAPKPPVAGSLLARLWPAVSGELANARAAGHVAPDATSTQRVEAPPLRRLVGWAPPPPEIGIPTVESATAPEPELLRFDWAGELARCVGVVYHRWVQRIADEGVEAWDGSRVAATQTAIDAELRDEGVPPAQRGGAVARVLEALANTLDDPRGRWLLGSSHIEAISEWALTAVIDDRPRRLVIDRSFVDSDGTRWIVDFKTSVHEGGDLEGFRQRERERYAGQLATYRSALRLLDGRPLRTALYLPLLAPVDARWIEFDGD